MKVITLASGSKGNCTLISTDKTNILVDAGISLGEIESKLNLIGIEPKDIYAILITHEHSDHIKNVGTYARKYDCLVIANEKEWPVLDSKLGKLNKEQKISFSNNNFYLQDLTICAFSLSHDCETCYGYSFYNQGNKISIATDFGRPTKIVLEHLKDSNIVILEANHDENLLLNNPKYSNMLKHRILSSKGHISNRTCAGIIRDIYSPSLQQVVLAHLSEENNSPRLAYETIKTELLQYGIEEGKHLYIDVASQHEIGHLFELKNE